MTEAPEMVDHPKHYNSHPSGVECIEICQHMTFNLGNAFKYGWRYNDKGDSLENLRKMLWYIERELTDGTTHLVADPAYRYFFGEKVMAPVHRRVFAQPSPWCEPIRHALAALCDYHGTAAQIERLRLLGKARTCILTAIDDETCLQFGRGYAM